MNKHLRPAATCAILCLLPGFSTPLYAESPNDYCPGLPFVYSGFYYECDDAQALLAGCSDNDGAPVHLGKRWYSQAGSFPNGITWGFTMKCTRLSDSKIANIPVACYVDDTEIDVDEATTYSGNRYLCEQNKDTGKLTLTFTPVCSEGDCEDGF